MSWLQKLFGKDDRFFRMLEASAEEARLSVRSVGHRLRRSPQAPSLEAVTQSRRRGKEIHEEISEYVIRSFVTALDREDIESLSTALHRIPKTAEKIACRFDICAQDLEGFDLTAHAATLESAVDHVHSRVLELRHGGNIDRIEAQTVRLRQVADESDRLLLALLGEITHRHQELGKVLVLRDLCRFLERLMDRCVEADEIVNQIVLKNT